MEKDLKDQDDFKETLSKVLSKEARVLIVEDDTTTEAIWSRIFLRLNKRVRVKWVTSEVAASNAIKEMAKQGLKYDLIISDIFLNSSKTGVDLWREYGKSMENNFILTSVISPVKFSRMIGGSTVGPLFLTKPIKVRETKEILEEKLCG